MSVINYLAQYGNPFLKPKEQTREKRLVGQNAIPLDSMEYSTISKQVFLSLEHRLMLPLVNQNASLC